MGCVSPVELIRLLLRLSDRQPIGALDGLDLAAFAPAFLDRLLETGVLVESAPLREADGLVVQVVGRAPVAFSVDGRDLTECVHPEALRRYEIDVLVLCKALRHANALNGAQVERLSHRLFYLGDHAAGGRRRPVYLARLLRAENALDTAFAVRGRSGPSEIVMLTPTVRPIGSELTRQLAHARVAVLAISEILSAGSKDPFALSIPIARLCVGTDPASGGRLVVDVLGHTVSFDGRAVNVAVREFNLLLALANEAGNDAGIVTYDTLYTAIQGVPTATDRLPNDEQIAKSVSLLRTALAVAAGLSRDERRTLIVNKSKIGYRLGLGRHEVVVL
jgi:hypothetical protein